MEEEYVDDDDDANACADEEEEESEEGSEPGDFTRAYEEEESKEESDAEDQDEEIGVDEFLKVWLYQKGSIKLSCTIHERWNSIRVYVTTIYV